MGKDASGKTAFFQNVKFSDGYFACPKESAFLELLRTHPGNEALSGAEGSYWEEKASDTNAMAAANGEVVVQVSDKVSNADYQNIKALVNGEINTLAGFNFCILEDRAEGGLTEAANVVDSYFYHTQAVGLATGIAPKTEINWIPERTSWLTNGNLKAGAVVRDSGGLVKVQYTKNA